MKGNEAWMTDKLSLNKYVLNDYSWFESIHQKSCATVVDLENHTKLRCLPPFWESLERHSGTWKFESVSSLQFAWKRQKPHSISWKIWQTASKISWSRWLPPRAARTLSLMGPTWDHVEFSREIKFCFHTGDPSSCSVNGIIIFHFCRQKQQQKHHRDETKKQLT